MNNIVSFPVKENNGEMVFDHFRKKAAPVVFLKRKLHWFKLGAEEARPILLDLQNGLGIQVYFSIPQFHPIHREYLTAIYPDDRGDHLKYEPIWLDSRKYYKFFPIERYLRKFPDPIREMTFDQILSSGGLLLDGLSALMFLEESHLITDSEWAIQRAVFESKNIRKEIRKNWPLLKKHY